MAAIAFYWRDLGRIAVAETPSIGRRIAFAGGLLAIYFVMQTRFDFLAQHMFFIHRPQHLVLHHVGPFLIALSQPLAVLACGTPKRLRRIVERVWGAPLVRHTYHLFQNAVVAPVLFVGLIGFWLTSRIHFEAMLSTRLYWLMNWSMRRIIADAG